MANRWGNNGNMTDYFLGLQLILMVIAATKLKDTWKKTYDIPIQLIKKQRHDFANKGPYSQSCGFSSNHVQM